MTHVTKFKDKKIEEIFLSYPLKLRERLLEIRELIFLTAEEMIVDSEIEETLKWGEPSYVSKYGSTVRINKIKGEDDKIGIYFNCKTTLISSFKERFGDEFIYEGNRALIFNIDDKIDVDNLKHCIYLSLTYFLKEKN